MCYLLSNLLIENPGNSYVLQFNRRRRFLVEESCENDCVLVKRLEVGYVFYIIKHATKITDKVNENMENISGNEESAIFDRSLDTLTSEIETNVIKVLKAVTMSEL